jgi:multidrug efflux pump subunit AcrA (membrane-fusion protein)
MTAGRQYESQVAGKSHDDPAHNRGRTKGLKSLLKVLFPLVALATGGLAALWLLETGPQARPRRGQRNAALVKVAEIRFGPQQTYVTAMGSVIPAREIDLKSQVTGEVREISRNFAPGGVFRRGDWLLRIDPTDYQIVARQLAGDVARAEANLKIEQGNQLIAKREYELLGEAVSDDERDLILRRPQLTSSRAALESAEARLEKARLDLSRTTVTSPFNAVV